SRQSPGSSDVPANPSPCAVMCVNLRSPAIRSVRSRTRSRTGAREPHPRLRSMVLETIDWRCVDSDPLGVTVRSVEFLGEGWTSWAYLVNAGLVFRFPKRVEAWQEIEREVA